MLHFAQRHTLFDSPYEVSLGAFADMIEEVVDVAVALTPPTPQLQISQQLGLGHVENR